MAQVIYIDASSGIAGDMMLAALIDAGLPVDDLRRALGSLGVGHDVMVSNVLRAGVSATHVRVVDREAGPDHPDRGPGRDRGVDHDHEHGHDHPHGQGHRSLREIAELIGHSALSASGKARAIAMFTRLAEAEAAVHAVPIEEVHLHEVGAVDSIIDIVGVVFALDWWGIDDIVASPVNVGGGMVRIAHGTFPVPAPATLRLLTGIPVYSTGDDGELATPTGALILSTYARAFQPLPAMTVQRTGYGAGTRDPHGRPNVVRLLIGERAPATAGAHASDDDVVEIACEIDDMSPQLFGPVTEQLFDRGALDVFLTAIQMKKGRPGTLLTVLARPVDRERLCEMIFRETTTIGVRFHRSQREILERRWVDVAVDGGVIRMKIASRRGEVLNAVPEFDDCVTVASRTGRPLKIVQADALRAWSAAERV